ncbi:MAG: AsmA family protein [Terriglobia bacterium]
MSRKLKVVLIAACIVIAFVVAVALIAPRLFQVDRYRPYVVSMIEQKTGRQVAMSRLDLTVFPSLTIRVENLAMANPAPFPPGNWLTVKRVNARLNLGALWHHRIVINSLELDQPTVTLLSNARGNWNYQVRPPQPLSSSGPGASGAGMRTVAWKEPRATAPARSAQGDPPLFSLQEISAVSLKGGRMTVASVLPAGSAGPPTVEAEGIAGNFKNIDFTSSTGSQPGNILPASATGTLTVKTLHAENVEATNVASLVQTLPTQVRLNGVKFDFYGGKGEGSIVLDVSGPAPKYTAQGSVSNVSAAALLAEFPQTRGELTGTLESHFALSDVSTPSPNAWAGAQGRGTLTIRRGRLPELRLDKTLLDLAHVAEIKAGSGDPSSFSSIDIEWQLEHGVVTTRSVRMLGNGIAVDASGALELAPPGRLNYEGVAKIAAAVNPLTNILANLSGATFAGGELSLPFRVGGNLQKPLFRLKQPLNHGLVNPLVNPNSAPNAIQNILKLFQRKK